MKIVFDKEGCIGCGSCAATCPEHWEMAEDGKADLKGSVEEDGKMVKEIEKEGCNRQAENICPVNVIKIIDN